MHPGLFPSLGSRPAEAKATHSFRKWAGCLCSSSDLVKRVWAHTQNKAMRGCSLLVRLSGVAEDLPTPNQPTVYRPSLSSGSLPSVIRLPGETRDTHLPPCSFQPLGSGFLSSQSCTVVLPRRSCLHSPWTTSSVVTAPNSTCRLILWCPGACRQLSLMPANLCQASPLTAPSVHFLYAGTCIFTPQLRASPYRDALPAPAPPSLRPQVFQHTRPNTPMGMPKNCPLTLSPAPCLQDLCLPWRERGFILDQTSLSFPTPRVTSTSSPLRPGPISSLLPTTVSPSPLSRMPPPTPGCPTRPAPSG